MSQSARHESWHKPWTTGRTNREVLFALLVDKAHAAGAYEARVRAHRHTGLPSCVRCCPVLLVRVRCHAMLQDG